MFSIKTDIVGMYFLKEKLKESNGIFNHVNCV